MHSQLLLWPYDEVKLHFEGAGLDITTPWMTLKVNLPESLLTDAKVLAEQINSGALSPSSLPLVQSFFGRLAAHPISYVLPTPKTAGNLDQFIREEDQLDLSNPHSLLQETLGENGKEIATDWAWDANDALNFASGELEKVHPESLFSIARRFHLLSVMQQDHGTEIFRSIESLPHEEFRQAALRLVRQNHFVTQSCISSLEPALERSGQARSVVEEFMNEENGHDLILGVALKSMTDSPENIPVTWECRTLMKLLKYCADRNFLAFAMAIDFFERSSYEAKDPLAKLLERGGFEKAARQIHRHQQINDAGEHENVAIGFLKWMDLVDRDFALEALRLAELVSLFMNSVTKAAAKDI